MYLLEFSANFKCGVYFAGVSSGNIINTQKAHLAFKIPDLDTAAKMIDVLHEVYSKDYHAVLMSQNEIYER